MAVCKRYPVGADRRDLGTAIAGAAIAAAFGAKGLEPHQLLPVKYEEDNRDERLYRQLLTYSAEWNARHGGNNCESGSEAKP